MKTQDKYEQILRDRRFSMRPKWVKEAISMWLADEDNFAKALRQEPKLCEIFADDIWYAVHVSKAIEISDRNKPTLKKLLRTLIRASGNYNDEPHPTKAYLLRLAKSGMADVILETVADLGSTMPADVFVKIAPYMDRKDIVRLLPSVNWGAHACIAYDVIDVSDVRKVLSKLGPEDFHVFISDNECSDSLVSWLKFLNRDVVAAICKAMPSRTWAAFLKKCIDHMCRYSFDPKGDADLVRKLLV
jgi:hypothetical protein